MKTTHRVASVGSLIAMAAATAIVSAGTAQAQPGPCIVDRHLTGATSQCAPGSYYVLDVDCFGFGSDSFDVLSVPKIFYHRTSYFAEPDGRASVSCAEGSWIGNGIATKAWVRVP
ncbi:MAG: hypothetical protein GX610_19610 [Rhodococcus sp.]|nr:hypothetical protein [Rhodococcus sp. (in: high G+C Gram-positive bacteria)]